MDKNVEQNTVNLLDEKEVKKRDKYKFDDYFLNVVTIIRGFIFRMNKSQLI